MKTNIEKIIELKQYREILQTIKFIQEAEEREKNNIHEHYVEGKPKVLTLTKKYNGKEFRVA